MRPIFHAALLLLATAYVLLIPLGYVPKDNRLQVEEVVLLGLLAIISSTLMESLAGITIGKHGLTARFKEMEHRQEKQEDELTRQQAEIRSLQVALQGIVTRYQLDKLVGLSKEGEFLCHYGDDLDNELKRLRALGLISNHAGTGLSDIRRDNKDRGEMFDLKRFFYITEEGTEYLKLRGDLMRTGSHG